ncbi:glycosyltransferase family 2 protein [Asaia spathodeae]|uniref:Glycosyltransferase family 2 protein n=1 Tax=Asaia spathodeae TaxID=657016 RepID=A0ABX2P2S2_9PROT|nr:glycosyltransferase family 2 protein [Asaia spathodeae]GBR17317.1 hypothetical protein AA105894_1790 [Asaia spathodeae NBRC 105894]
MAENLPSVAVALFVKNEFSDIAGWIAWHAALGVKTFLIYDDHSSDGTWEILQAAAKCYDIRLKRTDPIGQPDFYQRQRDSFMAAAAESRHQFDWLGFLDGDEYVYLRHFDNLPEFLRGFKHADAIAFSWRIQGSSNRVVRPKMTTVEAFTQHSNKSLNDNVLVKSFVRPEKMGNEYINPHWFDVATERYVRPSGRYVQSANAVQDIEWSHAFVMHYICRSMEHYIQRIKRRLNVDLSDSVGYWDHFNRNDETDLEPLKLLLRMDRYLAPIYEQMITNAILRLKSAIVMDDQGQAGTSVATNADQDIVPSIFRIRSYFNTYLYYAPRTGQVVHADENYAIEQGFEEVLGCIDPVTPKLITLFAPGNIDTFIKFSADPRLMKTIIFEVRPQSDDRIALLSPMQNFFLALLPPESGVGIAEVNRHQANEWEYLTLEPVNVAGPETYASPPPFVPGRETSISDIISWIRHAPVLPSNNEFLRVLYSVTPSVRAEISRLVPGLLWNALA